ncbi:TPA: hypothetical protein KRO81_001713 [Clostridioides difficile]|jgi:hypothetical protein|uniref:hypothetical protein n=1 Tax=Bacillota TaxID=1239 RepID=UPI0002DB15FB|nr:MULTISPECIES: hypothetical protein [Bacillota]EGP4887928.1 hypothetical protein [Enterococcus faecium]EGP5093445.1 hypothetical protein [Enterococcus faecium]EGP5131030.1 hypothetical protein [Enterococcus faecium]EGT3716679.1 hypothetical protein [Clostridioides difficile]EGT3720178.1 hypothetical protein [Clostridioides difficile]
MSYRVQFTISDAEKEQLISEAASEGYPNIAELCKVRALRGKSTYADLYKRMVKKIESLPSGQRFFLRDLIETPPTLLGRWLYDNVANGTIKDVKHLGNNGSDAEEYVKL